MATRVELPKELIKQAIDQAISLRYRQIKATGNAMIKAALEEELKHLAGAKDTCAEIIEPTKTK